MENTPHIAGFPVPHSASLTVETSRLVRPTWLTEELLRSTIELWSRHYGRTVDEDEAVEILRNVKRFCEALLVLEKERL